jgi:hypothetical protein
MVVCCEGEGLPPGPSLFDCGHAVCFACTTGMLLATYRDANFAMPCPYHSLNGCEGRVAVLPEHKVDAKAMLYSHPDAPEEWKRYVRRLDDEMLRAAGMFACPSAFCSTSERVLFVPTAAAHTSCNTQCECCGLSLCRQCTHLAGRAVPSHLPLPCSRQVEIQSMASNLQAALAREEEAARDREQARRREEHARHRERWEERWLLRIRGHSYSAWSREPREFPEIDAQIRRLLPAVGGISYAEIFRAAHTVATTTEHAHAAALFLPTAGWCANFVRKHALNILPPSLGELGELLRRHNRTKEAAILDQISAGTYRAPASEPAISDEELVMRTSKPCPTGCGWNIAKNKG